MGDSLSSKPFIPSLVPPLLFPHQLAPHLFPTARSLTPSSPTRSTLHRHPLRQTKVCEVITLVTSSSLSSPLLISLRWFTWLMRPPFTHSLMLISLRSRSLLAQNMSTLVLLYVTSTFPSIHVFAVYSMCSLLPPLSRHSFPPHVFHLFPFSPRLHPLFKLYWHCMLSYDTTYTAFKCN